MKKLLQLIRVMRKCGRAEKEGTSASSHTGNTSDILIPGVAVAIAVAMFFAGRYLAEHQDTMGSVESIFSTIMMLGALVSFVMSIPQVINHLYMSKDLDVLVTLPFSGMQLVACKLVNILRLPLLICAGMVIPCGIGFGITAGGFGVLYWVGLILSAPMLAMCMVSLAGILVILLMRAFRFIRSRNIISVVSTLLIFVAMLAYSTLSMNSSSIDFSQMGQAFVALSSAFSGLTQLVPVIGLCLQSMTGGGVLSLLLAIAITAAVVAVLLLVARLFYFAAALGMQDATGTKSRMTDSEFRKATRSSSARTALRRREISTILRTPAMITNGYLYSIVLPVLMLVFMVVRMVSAFSDEIAATGAVITLDTLLQLVKGMAIGWEMWLIVITCLMLFMCSLAVALSVLSRGCISREGKDYAALKAMPLPMETIVMVKRNVAMLFNGISGFFLPMLIVIAAVVLGFAPIWVIPAAAVVGLGWLVFAVDLCCLVGVQKPNLNWEAEADACKNNIPGLIFWGVSFIVVIAGMIFAFDFELSDIVVRLIVIAVSILPVVLALLFDIRLRKAAAQLAERY